MVVNALFDLGLNGLNLLRGIVLAALLSRSAFGIWGILTVSLGVLAQLKLVGISDKYVQQDERDQQLAFQRAFTLELIVNLATAGVLLAALPVICLIYGRWQLLAPGIVLASMLVAYAFQSPQWVFYRNMDFVTQRLQTAVEPVVGLAVAVVLAIAGWGYWALVLGAVAGAWSGAAVAVRMSPYPLALRLDRRAVSVYWRFSGPVLVATVATVIMANGTVIATNAHLGLGAVGAVAMATTILSFTTKVDDTVAATMYPGICAIVDRADLLRESFTKTNRLAMLWAIPFGVGLTLFAPQLIHYVLGDKWHVATRLLEITGIVAALNHIGFNWDDYYRAQARTVPMAVVAVTAAVVTLGTGVPLLLHYGLSGLAWGLALGTAAAFLLRIFYVRALFDGFGLLAHGWRALAPVLPALGAVLALRALLGGGMSVAATVGELTLYLAIVVAGSWLWERALLAEALAYVRRRVA